MRLSLLGGSFVQHHGLMLWSILQDEAALLRCTLGFCNNMHAIA